MGFQRRTARWEFPTLDKQLAITSDIPRTERAVQAANVRVRVEEIGRRRREVPRWHRRRRR